MKRVLGDPLIWLFALLLVLIFGMTSLGGVFHWLFPELSRPVYQQESFAALVEAHLLLVGVSSLIAVIIGVTAGVGVTRPAGKEFRSLVETLVAMGQTFPPVAVLAIAVPVMGFSEKPAIIALVLYGLLPILQGTIAGIESVPASAREIAQGVGMSRWQLLRNVEIPLAAPVISTAPISSEPSASARPEASAAYMASFNAFFLAGRFMVSRSTAPTRSQRTASLDGPAPEQV